jgi:hypothetical protein
MAELILFDLPAEEDPEAGAPDLVQHGCDYMVEGDRLLYYYNFITYSWGPDGDRFFAKAYLHHSEIAMFTASYDRIVGKPGFDAVLRYLQRRFPYIKTLEKEGYEVRFRARHAPDLEVRASG